MQSKGTKLHHELLLHRAYSVFTLCLSFILHAGIQCHESAFGMQMRALDKKANKVEKLKNKKGGEAMWSEVHELGQLIR